MTTVFPPQPSAWPHLWIENKNTNIQIQLLESPIPPAPPAPSQKASSGGISGTKRGSIDPLVSKQPEKFGIRKKRRQKNHKKREKKHHFFLNQQTKNLNIVISYDIASSSASSTSAPLPRDFFASPMTVCKCKRVRPVKEKYYSKFKQNEIKTQSQFRWQTPDQ